jgi:cytidylate kinase
MVIAIDGPAGSGKSTVARGVAAALGWTYLDSGAMYRCVALAVARGGVDAADPDAVGVVAREIEIGVSDDEVRVDGADVSEAIRAPEISAIASQVAAHAQVREALVARQRELIAAGRHVAEGRDIGTVVSPDAPLKVFLVAAEAERARRRAADTGEDEAAVSAAQAERDARDRERAHSPLRPAPDAVELDTTRMTAAEVIGRVVELAHERGLR